LDRLRAAEENIQGAEARAFWTQRGNFKEMHRMITGFKSWLRGIHHHAQHLQAYVDAYSSRFNRSFIHETVFQNLLDKMVASDPHPFKTIVRG